MHVSKPKILILEKVSPNGLALLQARSEVYERKSFSPQELKSIIGDWECE